MHIATLHCIATWAVLPLGGLRRERRSHAAQPTPDSQVYTASLRCSRASTQSPQPHEEEDKCCGLHHHLRHHLEPSCWCGGISSEFIRTPMKTDVALGPGSKKANLCAHLLRSKWLKPPSRVTVLTDQVHKAINANSTASKSKQRRV
jgi:hypothetical protein